MVQRKRTALIAWGSMALIAGGVLMAANSLAVGIDAQPPAFESRMVDGVSNFGEWNSNRGYAIAADGTQYAAYGGDHLYLAKMGPSDTEWQIETVDSTWRVGKFTSLALDSNGNPHISYTNHSDARDIKYARWNGNKWLIETVDGADSDVGRWNAIALDSNNRPHIVYTWVRQTDGWDHNSPKYAHWDGSAWQISDVDIDSNMGDSDSNMPLSIAVDSSNTPHISYFQSRYWDGIDWNNNKTGNLRYATRNGSSWVTSLVDDNGKPGKHNSIAVDSTGKPHISYQEYNSYDLRYARWDGSDWQTETVDYDNVYNPNSIALDSNNYPHIAYYDGGPNAGMIASWNGSSWDMATVYDPYINTSTSLRATSIALDNSDQPHVLYRDSNNAQRIVTATWDGSEWQPGVVDRSGSAAHRNDIALDNKGYTHISYRVSTKDRFGTTGQQYETSELRYGHWDGKEWQIETVAAAPAISDVPEEYTHSNAYYMAGIHNAIALGSTGKPHFSYFQRAYGYDNNTSSDLYDYSLNHAYWDGSAWVTERLVPSVGNYGSDYYPFTSIAVDSKGYVHISYYDESNYRPMYIRQDATGWLPPEQVGDYCDGSNDCGNWSDMALDSMDRPHISYHNRDMGELIYAYFDGTDWQTTMVDDCYNNDECGKSTSIVLDGSDTPHISYRDGGWDDGSPNGNATAKYATMNGGSWTTETVAYLVGGGDTGIALSPGGMPHITYWDGYFKAPRHVTPITVEGGPTIWYSTFIDDARSMDAVEDGDQGPMMGKWNNIVMDPAGNPQFVYSDQTTQNVRHAGKLKMGGPFSWPMFVPAITGMGVR